MNASRRHELIINFHAFSWSKISKAMNGRRTPRQVASRVQKYFEKLKRFGVDLKANGAGTALVPMD